MSSPRIALNPDNIACNHSYTEHFFNPWKCEDLPIEFRAAVVALHILTLGIPLAIYTIVSCCFPRVESESNNHFLELRDRALASYTKWRESETHLSIIDKVEKRIEKINKDLLGDYRFYITEEPNAENPPESIKDVAALLRFDWEGFQREFGDNVTNSNGEAANPFYNKKVINKATRYLETAYALASETIDNLELLTDKIKTKNNDQNLIAADIIFMDGEYPKVTIFSFLKAYHRLRSGSVGFIYASSPNDPPSPETLFYQKGTAQYQWRELYNHVCERLSLYRLDQYQQAADPFPEFSEADLWSEDQISKICSALGIEDSEHLLMIKDTDKDSYDAPIFGALESIVIGKIVKE